MNTNNANSQHLFCCSFSEENFQLLDSFSWKITSYSQFIKQVAACLEQRRWSLSFLAGFVQDQPAANLESSAPASNQHYSNLDQLFADKSSLKLFVFFSCEWINRSIDRGNHEGDEASHRGISVYTSIARSHYLVGLASTPDTSTSSLSATPFQHKFETHQVICRSALYPFAITLKGGRTLSQKIYQFKRKTFDKNLYLGTLGLAVKLSQCAYLSARKIIIL